MVCLLGLLLVSTQHSLRPLHLRHSCILEEVWPTQTLELEVPEMVPPLEVGQAAMVRLRRVILQLRLLQLAPTKLGMSFNGIFSWGRLK